MPPPPTTMASASSTGPSSPLPSTPKERRSKVSSTIALISAFIVTISFFVVGVIFIAFPLVSRNLLYPCLSNLEHEANGEKVSSSLVELDILRITGACFLSIGMASIVSLIPLLFSCIRGQKDYDYDNDTSGSQRKNNAADDSADYILLRMVFFLQGTMGLALIGVGLLNLSDAEYSHSYEERGNSTSNSKINGQRYQCSSLNDQTVLWMGAAIVCITSLGLMASFWPQPSTITNGDGLDHLNNDSTTNSLRNNQTTTRAKPWCCLCWKVNRTHPLPSENGSMDPLLPDVFTTLTEEVTTADVRKSDTIGSDSGESDSLDIETSGISSNYAKNEQENDTSVAQSSRLRGTSRLLKLAGKQSLYLFFGIIFLLIRLPFSLAVPNFVAATIGDLINNDYDGAKRSVLILFVLGTVDSVLDFWVIFLFGYAKENIVKGLRLDTFTAIMHQEQAFFDKSSTGDLLSLVTNDCGEMAEDLTWFFRFSVEALVRISFITVYMMVRSPFLGLCTIAIVPAVGVINKLYGDWLGRNALNIQSTLGEASSCAHESFSCAKTVITSAYEDHECKKYSTKIDKLYDLLLRQVIASGVYFMAVSTFLINTCVQAALLLLGSYMVERGKLTPETLLAFMLYQGQLQEYTLNFFRSFSSLVKSSGAGDRVFRIIDRQPPPPGTGSLAVRNLSTQANAAKTNHDISITDVSFYYPSRPEILALKGLSLEIRKGSLVALVGHSGCGKSTIISLLERLYDPVSGTISFGGVDLRNMNLRAHREKIGIVTQDPALFSGTIEENIGYGTALSFEEVVDAAKVANAHNFVESFPEKYRTQVGEKGTNLSGGQKQRIAIARAIAKKPSLLLLDEATSALDPESEAAVQVALNELIQNRSGMTVVIVAHRLQTVRNAEMIAVIENGLVVERGNHEQLVKNEQGHYRKLVDKADSMGNIPDT